MIHSYHVPIWTGVGIKISIGKIFSSVLGIKNIGKSDIGRPLVFIVPSSNIHSTTSREPLFDLGMATASDNLFSHITIDFYYPESRDICWKN